MKAFQMAVSKDVREEEEEETLEFSLGDEDFVAKYPTSGQLALVLGGLGGSETEAINAIFTFLGGIMRGNNGLRRIKRMLENGEIEMGTLFGGDDDNEMGLIENILEAASDRPTPAPSDSSASSQQGGKRSTGRSPGKGSTHSG